ncbi:uncharacterized protein CXQ87_004619 [Candidozyma duobushaemuli]|nr:uncharacterized protein CXQ87_004619 [[Candida] duobushaemulonis]PVH17059.1 hypothetical protein CXQ87_004619 [[Candida] duobushaemulonis]
MPSLVSRLTYPSPRLALAAISVPWVAAKSFVQYYTSGTIYQKTDPEFDTLYKNVVVAVLAVLATAASATDAKFMPYPMKSMFKKQRGRGAAKEIPHFGEAVAGEDTFLWVARPESAKTAILYLHGGGYSFPLAPAQLVGMMGVWWAVSSEKRQNLAIAVLDYKLTTYAHYYPTQLYEATRAYRQLVDLGYEVVVKGDSCGSNLALAVARFFAYPAEAKAHFSQWPQFDWDFSPLPAPKHLILTAPWTSPTCAAVPFPGMNHKGEFIALSINKKGKLYIKGSDRDAVAPWVEFNQTNYKEHWAEVPAFNGEGSVLYIYGEREYFRASQESFAEECGVHNFDSVMQPGAIHDCLFVVEVLDISGKKGQQAMVRGDHRQKFTFGRIGKFLDEIL